MAEARADKLVRASDGRLARVVGVWSKEKLHYLAHYCGIFNRGMQHQWPTRVYVDLFSGPGRCVIRGTSEEIDGSPLVAARTAPGFTHLICNDIDARVVEALQARLSSTTHSQAQVLNLDCNEAAAEIALRLDRIAFGKHLSLCFIDPTGWQVTLESVRQLTAGRRMDLLVVFNSGYMKRTVHQEPSRLTAFFGDDPLSPAWSQLYREGRYSRMGTSALIEHYMDRLRGLGYEHFNHDVSVEKDNHGTPLYQMLFASRSPLGKQFFSKIAKSRHDGQRRLF